jgi:cyclopropane-fatty-acyl-phospholipid synthase
MARRSVLWLAQRMQTGTIVLHEDAAHVTVGRGAPVIGVTIHDRRAFRALLRGSTGLGDGYMRGWWDCDDLTDLVRVLLRSLARPLKSVDRAGAAARPLRDPVARLRHRRDRQRDRSNIRAHYDIGNEFYALMLDPTMSYSCGLAETPGASLAEMQAAKLDRICRLLDLSPADHLVEIGTGWGSFAVHAATKFGCRVTTTTISDAQYDEACSRVARSGLAERVNVRNVDYRDLEGTYDKLVSIEMIEAVDWRDYDMYFGTCARLLRPGGLAALQAIVVADEAFERAKHHDDFIRRYIFPGGCLPSIGSLAVASSRAGFQMLDLHDIGAHYPATLRAWRDNVHTAELGTLGMDSQFRRMWDFYLAYCEAAFLERRVGDVQVLLTKMPGRDESAATRAGDLFDDRERVAAVGA